VTVKQSLMIFVVQPIRLAEPSPSDMQPGKIIEDSAKQSRRSKSRDFLTNPASPA
jgi:hypothetical protein